MSDQLPSVDEPVDVDEEVEPRDLTTSPIRVALLNDFDIVVAGLASMLSPFPQIAVVDRSVGDVSIEVPADIALYDTYGRRGIPWLEVSELVAEPLAKHVAIFTFANSHQIAFDALRRGVDGFLWKGLSPRELVEALVAIASGERIVQLGPEGRRPSPTGQRWPFDAFGLTARESEVLALLAEGLTNRQIADALYVGPETVKTHVRHIFRKLSVHTRSEATAMAMRDDSFSRQSRRLTSD